LFRGGKQKLFRWFFGQPILPFALQLVVLMPLILAANPGQLAGGYLFALPWLLPIFGVLNLPFVVGAFRSFRLDTATKRNHALEHATILHLEESTRRQFSGRASANGFRISGHASLSDIRAAFERVRRTVRSGEPLRYISPRCGSNTVTALGFAIVLLSLVALASVLLHPPLFVRAGALTAVVLAFVGLRHGIGNAIQRRFFMAVDFAEVSLRDVRSVPQRALDRGPAHFVETIVRPQSTMPLDRSQKPTSGVSAPR
jgi:hypothetical protein